MRRNPSPNKAALDISNDAKSNLLLHPKQGFYPPRFSDGRKCNESPENSRGVKFFEYNMKFCGPFKIVSAPTLKKTESENLIFVKERKLKVSENNKSLDSTIKNMDSLGALKLEEKKSRNSFSTVTSSTVLRERLLTSPNVAKQGYLVANQKKDLQQLLNFDQQEKLKFDTKTVISSENPSEDVLPTEEAVEELEEKVSARYLALDNNKTALESDKGELPENKPLLIEKRREIMDISKFTMAHAKEFYKRKSRDGRKKLRIPTVTRDQSPSSPGISERSDGHMEELRADTSKGNSSGSLEESQKLKAGGKFTYSSNFTLKTELEKKQVKGTYNANPPLNNLLSKKDIILVRYKPFFSDKEKANFFGGGKHKPVKIEPNKNPYNYRGREKAPPENEKNRASPEKSIHTPKQENHIERVEQALNEEASLNLLNSKESKSLSPKRELIDNFSEHNNKVRERGSSLPKEKSKEIIEKTERNSNEEKKRKLLLKLEMEKILAQQRKPTRVFAFTGKKEKKAKDIFQKRERLIPNLAQIDEIEETGDNVEGPSAFYNKNRKEPSLESLPLYEPLSLRAVKSESHAFSDKANDVNCKDDELFELLMDSNNENLLSGITKKDRLKVELNNKTAGNKKSKGKNSAIRKGDITDEFSEASSFPLKGKAEDQSQKRDGNKDKPTVIKSMSSDLIDKYWEFYAVQWRKLSTIDVPQIKEFGSDLVSISNEIWEQITSNCFYEVDMKKMKSLVVSIQMVILDCMTSLIVLLKNINLRLEKLKSASHALKKGEQLDEATIFNDIDTWFQQLQKIEESLLNLGKLKAISELSDETFPGIVEERAKTLIPHITNSQSLNAECARQYCQLIAHALAESYAFYLIVKETKSQAREQYSWLKDRLSLLKQVKEGFPQQLAEQNRILIEEIELKYETLIPVLNKKLSLKDEKEEWNLRSDVNNMESKILKAIADLLNIKEGVKKLRCGSNDIYIQEECENNLTKTKKLKQIFESWLWKINKLKSIFAIRQCLNEMDKQSRCTSAKKPDALELKEATARNITRLVELRAQIIENNFEEFDILRTGDILGELNLGFMAKAQSVNEKGDNELFSEVSGALEVGQHHLNKLKEPGNIRQLVFSQTYEGFLKESDSLELFISRCEQTRGKIERRKKNLSERNKSLYEEFCLMIKHLSKQKNNYIYNSCKSFSKKGLCEIKLTEVLDLLKRSEASSKEKCLLLKASCRDFIKKHKTLALKMKGVNFSKTSENWLHIKNCAESLERLFDLTSLETYHRIQLHERESDAAKAAFSKLPESNLLGLTHLDFEVYLLHLKNIKKNSDNKMYFDFKKRLDNLKQFYFTEQLSVVLSELDPISALSSVEQKLKEANCLLHSFTKYRDIARINQSIDEELYPDHKQILIIQYISRIIALIIEVKIFLKSNGISNVSLRWLALEIGTFVENSRLLLCDDFQKIGKFEIPAVLTDSFNDLIIIAQFINRFFMGVHEIINDLNKIAESFASANYELILGDRCYNRFLKKLIFLSKFPKPIFQEIGSENLVQIGQKLFKKTFRDLSENLQMLITSTLENFSRGFDLVLVEEALPLMERYLNENWAQNLNDCKVLINFLLSNEKLKLKGRDNISSFMNILEKLLENIPKIELIKNWVREMRSLGELRSQRKLSNFNGLETISEDVDLLLSIQLSEIKNNVDALLATCSVDMENKRLKTVGDYASVATKLLQITNSNGSTARILKNFYEIFVFEVSSQSFRKQK